MLTIGDAIREFAEQRAMTPTTPEEGTGEDMSKGVNEVTLVGNIGNDPEVRFGKSGTAVTNLRLAVNERVKDGDGYVDHTEWFSVTVFGKTAEAVGEYLHKGSKLYVKGRGQTRDYTDKDGNERRAFEVVARDVVFLDPPPQKASRAPRERNELRESTPANQGFARGEDLPF